MIIQNTTIVSLKGVELLGSVLGSNHPNTLQAISVQIPAEIKINKIIKENIYFCFHSQNEKFSAENFCIVLLSTVLLLIKIFIVSSYYCWPSVFVCCCLFLFLSVSLCFVPSDCLYLYLYLSVSLSTSISLNK